MSILGAAPPTPTSILGAGRSRPRNSGPPEVATDRRAHEDETHPEIQVGRGGDRRPNLGSSSLQKEETTSTLPGEGGLPARAGGKTHDTLEGERLSPDT